MIKREDIPKRSLTTLLCLLLFLNSENVYFKRSDSFSALFEIALSAGCFTYIYMVKLYKRINRREMLLLLIMSLLYIITILVIFIANIEYSSIKNCHPWSVTAITNPDLQRNGIPLYSSNNHPHLYQYRRSRIIFWIISMAVIQSRNPSPRHPCPLSVGRTQNRLRHSWLDVRRTILGYSVCKRVVKIYTILHRRRCRCSLFRTCRHTRGNL